MSAVEKLEKPTRVRELQIGRVLDCLAVSGERSFCDIGAGTGLFALEAAARTRGQVYALEVSDEMLALLRERRDAKRLDNIDIRRVEGPLPLDDASCDRCLLSTVYHELDDRQAMLREIVRVLRPRGRLAVIEFRPEDTPMGPPLEKRVSPETLIREAAEAGLGRPEHFMLGDNLYCCILHND